eukprot:TRINITY_DN8456_c0_g1_i1.p1 TRINITY_DN8456_c0_g1~~TRINITY_DN8456_c0_g1_i1.p1  ORF type:complete len:730 (-),score=211.25 TRINITY_DN8456_c0_g1_i1:55-2244(-)
MQRAASEAFVSPHLLPRDCLPGGSHRPPVLSARGVQSSPFGPDNSAQARVHSWDAVPQRSLSPHLQRGEVPPGYFQPTQQHEPVAVGALQRRPLSRSPPPSSATPAMPSQQRVQFGGAHQPVSQQHMPQAPAMLGAGGSRYCPLLRGEARQRHEAARGRQMASAVGAPPPTQQPVGGLGRQMLHTVQSWGSGSFPQPAASGDDARQLRPGSVEVRQTSLSRLHPQTHSWQPPQQQPHLLHQSSQQLEPVASHPKPMPLRKLQQLVQPQQQEELQPQDHHGASQLSPLQLLPLPQQPAPGQDQSVSQHQQQPPFLPAPQQPAVLSWAPPILAVGDSTVGADCSVEVATVNGESTTTSAASNRTSNCVPAAESSAARLAAAVDKSSIMSPSRLAASERKLAAVEEELRALRQEQERRNAEVEELNAEKCSLREELDREAAAREEQRTSQTIQLEELKRSEVELRRLLTEKENQEKRLLAASDAARSLEGANRVQQAKHEAEVAQRDAEIIRLRGVLEEKNSELQKLQCEMETLRRQVRQEAELMNNRQQDDAEEVGQLRAALEERDGELQRLQRQMDMLKRQAEDDRKSARDKHASLQRTIEEQRRFMSEEQRRYEAHQAVSVTPSQLIEAMNKHDRSAENSQLRDELARRERDLEEVQYKLFVVLKENKELLRKQEEIEEAQSATDACDQDTEETEKEEKQLKEPRSSIGGEGASMAEGELNASFNHGGA